MEHQSFSDGCPLGGTGEVLQVGSYLSAASLLKLRQKKYWALVQRAAYFLHLEKVRSIYPTNLRVNAIDKALDVGDGDTKSSFGRDRFLAFNYAGKTASPVE